MLVDYLGVASHDFERALSVLTKINYRSKDNPGPNATDHHPRETISNIYEINGSQVISDFRQTRCIEAQWPVKFAVCF